MFNQTILHHHSSVLKFIHWFSTPSSPNILKKNFINVQVDAIGIGLANAATPFLPVFLTLLGASNFQVGLLTAMPAVTGFLLAIPIGNILQNQRNIVPWFSRARLLVITAYALTGIATRFIPNELSVVVVLGIWAIATIPQTIVSIGFTVVMNAVAGPTGRFELMSRRWSILGFTTALTVVAVGQVLDRLSFPFNYQMVFIALSIGGLISFYFSSHIEVPDQTAGPKQSGLPLRKRVSAYIEPIWQKKAFLSFILKRFVYLSGISFAVPLFPLYYVREVQASEAWIGIFSTAQTAILIIGYFVWMRQSRRRGAKVVLTWTTLGLSFHPLLVGLTHEPALIALYAGFAGIFQAGVDLIFFDELMRTVPSRSSATFVSFAQSLFYFSNILSPMIGTLLADLIGLSGALFISFAIRIAGFLLFVTAKPAVQVPLLGNE